MRFLIKGILFLSLIYSITQAQQLKIYQIDVNTGDAALIISPTNKYILIDAGDDRHSYGDTVLRFLQNLGITHLDDITISHYHEDHIGGIPRVIYGLSGSTSNDSLLGWCYDRGDTYTSSMFINYKNAVGNKRRTVGLGETLDLGGGAFMFCATRNGKVMNGDSVLPNSGENYRSLVWVVKYGLFKFYTGGDLVGYNVSGERDVETKVAPVIRTVDVIKANHHGSGNSSNPTFLDSLRPKAVVISQGTDPVNNNHPHQEALDRYVARNIYIYQMNTNPSGGTFPSYAGRILNTTAAITVDNAIYTINGDTYVINSVNRNGACLDIIQPKDTITEATIIAPQVRIQNLGNTTESFRIRFRINPSYNRTQTVSNLAPNDTMTVVFDTMWYAMRGNYQVTCSTEVFGDSNPADDKQTAALTVAFFDNEVSDILDPTAGSTVYYDDTIIPTAIVKDNSEFSYPIPIKIFSQIRNNSNIVYNDSIERTSIPGVTDTIDFMPYLVTNIDEGVYSCSVWVTRNNDCFTDNNYRAVQFNIRDPNSVAEEEISPIGNHQQKLKSVVLKLYNISGRLIEMQTIQKPSDNIINQSADCFKNIVPGIYILHIIGTPLDTRSVVFKSIRKIVILPHN